MDKRLIALFSLILLISYSAIIINAKEVIVPINFPTPKNIPVINHIEMTISGDTVDVNNIYDIKYLASNHTFICGITYRSKDKISVWDYEIFINDSLVFNKYVLETKEDNATYMVNLECPILNFTGELVQSYKIKNFVKNIVSDYLYPFDKYAINYSWGVQDYPIEFSVNAVLPQNTYPTENTNDSDANYVYGPYISGGKVVFSQGNETLGTFDYVYLGGKIITPIISYDEKSYSITYPPLGVAALENIVNNQTSVTVSIGWERPLLIKVFFFISLFLITALTLLLLSNPEKLSLWEYTVYSFTIWGFQEGLTQLIPMVRPLKITMFELPIFIPITIISVYFLDKILNKLCTLSG